MSEPITRLDTLYLCVCNWSTHLQPEWQTISYWRSHSYSVGKWV